MVVPGLEISATTVMRNVRKNEWNMEIMGDGASYIKAGVKWIEKSVFVLDLFHLEKYINHLNYDEYLKGKLQEAIDQYDPISTENIMNEAIKKIKEEIKEFYDFDEKFFY